MPFPLTIYMCYYILANKFCCGEYNYLISPYPTLESAYQYSPSHSHIHMGCITADT